jgi:hypothetical protein
MQGVMHNLILHYYLGTRTQRRRKIVKARTNIIKATPTGQLQIVIRIATLLFIGLVINLMY